MREDAAVEREAVVAVVFDLVMLVVLADRNGFRGGSGIGGSAGFVLSYRRATRPVSSRNEDLVIEGRFVWRTEENLVGTMAAAIFVLSFLVSYT